LVGDCTGCLVAGVGFFVGENVLPLVVGPNVGAFEVAVGVILGEYVVSVGE
jgi:hypothetical protein